MAAAGIGAALLMIACCAGPALMAAGAVAGIGGFLGNPWVIAAAVLVLAAAVTAAVRHRRGRRDACCPPTGSRSADRDRSQAKVPARRLAQATSPTARMTASGRR
ncbi:hypothetical protein ABZ137_34490 [Streptomyces bobili]|uniref:hypothetical protein n=1 Tax=Streptomyces bobili TaxID=67280 RepID=UPI0033B7923E